MNTIRQVQQQIEAEPQYWSIHLMDFVDDFRYYKDLRMIEEPIMRSDERFDAILASTVESLCDELGLTPPLWLATVPACHEDWYVSGMKSLKQFALIESPSRFRSRKIFVLGNFLKSCLAEISKITNMSKE